ncbi:cation diffusion facilitator family transporter [Thermomonospora amylolytica]|uniref:cation diffusion facilitator family transporter n=1 Tax=Thermomonospora amylolytica TaxID=1411117 RepID=UPI000E6D2E71|nr:cation diffusion facilitator family transporter [Thermomonospora amylolytica]
MGHHHHGRGPLGRIAHLLRPHSHEPAGRVDREMESAAEGMRALWISVGGLGLTTLVQAAVAADGLHARADGFTSLAVLAGAAGVAAGWRWADPVVGLAITAAILAVLRQAGREVCHRLMDAVDPALVDRAEETLRGTPGVLGVGAVRLRWLGHRLRAECEVVVDHRASAVEAHAVAVAAEHALLHALPRLHGALVHADPRPVGGADHHAVLANHR